MLRYKGGDSGWRAGRCGKDELLIPNSAILVQVRCGRGVAGGGDGCVRWGGDGGVRLGVDIGLEGWEGVAYDI